MLLAPNPDKLVLTLKAVPFLKSGWFASHAMTHLRAIIPSTWPPADVRWQTLYNKCSLLHIADCVCIGRKANASRAALAQQPQAHL